MTRAGSVHRGGPQYATGGRRGTVRPGEHGMGRGKYEDKGERDDKGNRIMVHGIMGW